MTPIPLTDRRQAAAALKSLRLERGYSMGQLAYKLGCGVSTLNYRERGDRAFTLDVLARTGQALGYRVELVPTRATRYPRARTTGTGWPA